VWWCSPGFLSRLRRWPAGVVQVQRGGGQRRRLEGAASIHTCCMWHIHGGAAAAGLRQAGPKKQGRSCEGWRQADSRRRWRGSSGGMLAAGRAPAKEVVGGH
jgi:hypothetical protein